MRTALKTVVREHGGVGFIMADYVQKMKLKGNHKLNRNDELSEISGDLKRIAMEFNCPFLCLSQLSKACESRPDKRPMMSDLRDCGSLEADADAVIMLYREERYYPLKVESKGIAELIFCKNRNGQVGTVFTRFDGATFRFSDIQHSDYDEE
jgi:replicative DNA helicase